MALGRAIQGIGCNPNAIVMARELADQLLLVCKRLTWVEKTSDPEYKPDGKPREPRQATAKPFAPKATAKFDDDIRKES